VHAATAGDATHHLVTQRTRVQNQVHAILARYLAPTCPHADLFSGVGRRWAGRPAAARRRAAQRRGPPAPTRISQRRAGRPRFQAGYCCHRGSDRRSQRDHQSPGRIVDRTKPRPPPGERARARLAVICLVTASRHQPALGPSPPPIHETVCSAGRADTAGPALRGSTGSDLDVRGRDPRRDAVDDR
jgi:hypothetical protein